MHKDGRVWDSLNLNLLSECKSRRTGVKNATWMFFWQSLSMKILSLFISTIFNSSHESLWLRAVLWTATPISSLDYMVGKFQKWKAAEFKRVPYLHRDRRRIYPFYRQVLTPAISINTRHLSRPAEAPRAVPHHFHSWVNHPTSHLCFQTRTHPTTHARRSPQSLLVPKWANFSADLGFVWLY